MQKIANFVTEKRWYVVGFWIVAAALVVTFSPQLSDSTSNDQASFLPSEYESAVAQDIASEAFPQEEGQPALILLKRSDGKQLTPADKQEVLAVTQELNNANIDKVTSVVTASQLVSENGKIQLVTAQIDAGLGTGPQDEAVLESIKELRLELSEQTDGTDLTYAVTGSLAISLDTQESTGDAEMIVGLVTVLLILLLPTIVFRSPFAGILSLVSVGIVYVMSTSLLALTAQIFDFNVNGQLTALLIVVLFGIGTDYILFLLFRYRERLRSGDHTRGAVSFALTRAGEAILSAALVVAAAFTAMFAASLGFFSSLAPGLVISVLLMLVAVLTLVPALLAIIGDKIFWPSKKWQTAQKGDLSGRLGSLVANNPIKVSAIVLLALGGLMAGMTQYKTTFDLISQLPPDTESSKGFKEMTSAFPAGTSSPTTVYVKSDSKLTQESLLPLATALSEAKGVANILPVRTSDPGSSAMPQPAQLSPDGKAATISLILDEDPTSTQAMEDVSGPIRDAAHSTGLDAQIAVGGETASYADLQEATTQDILTIVPIAAGIIFVILAVLLRSLVAPIYLLISVGIGVVATLGATSLLFVGLGDGGGLIFMLPILLYLFVVAVGTDYNILMITRLREEIHKEGKHPEIATKNAIEHTAPTLISAGVILAGTFASLMLAGLSLLTQMGFSVAFGISLGAFVISLILIPAVSTVLGRWVWWPSKVKKERR